MSSISGKSRSLAVRIPPVTPEQRDAARAPRRRNATSSDDLRDLLDALGIEESE